MGKASKKRPADERTDEAGAQPSFEEALQRLETIVDELEDGEIGLSEGLARYEEGVKLLKQCYGLLERAERRIELLSGVDEEGNPLTEPFDDEATVAADDTAKTRSARRSSRRRSPSGHKPPDDDAGAEETQGLF